MMQKKSYLKRSRAIRIPRIKPRADVRLKGLLASVGVPERKPFQPDAFQLAALAALEHADCLVTAPTGAGKTWIAERAIARCCENGSRSWYASPLKALTNSKYDEFGGIFGAENVGILTGDRKENADAPIIVGTTEILRNQLYDAMHLGEDVPTDLVILDEAHFLGDRDRGVVWEEVLIYLPSRIPILMLSATIGNADQIAAWLSSIRGSGMPRRNCVVVQENHRPVELCHLFLHPSGMLFPLLESAGNARAPKARLDRKVMHYVHDENPPLFSRPNALPPFGQIIRVLKTYRLLPAIFFLKSRADCDRALESCQLQESQRVQGLRQRIGEYVVGSHLEGHPQLAALENRAVGAHHAGQLPAWKLLLERLMVDGLLDAIFATSTVAAGVNFPARTIVFLNSDRFNGQQFVPLTPTEFHQMIGRAGRRGMDRIGFSVVLPGPFMDLQAIAQLAGALPSDVESQIRIDFSMALNLLLSHTPKQVETLLEKSFAAFVAGEGGRHRYQRLLMDFSRHLAFLTKMGYVTREGKLTATGQWASQLRVDQPLLIAECLRQGVLPVDPALLAAIVAVFVNDREWEGVLDEHRLPKKLVHAFVQVQRSLNTFGLQMARQGFLVRPLFVQPAAVMYAWASGRSWESVIQESQGTSAGGRRAAATMAEGDLSMLILRTADNLRHIKNLNRVFPQVAEAAGRAIDRILREPVILD